MIPPAQPTPRMILEFNQGTEKINVIHDNNVISIILVQEQLTMQNAS